MHERGNGSLALARIGVLVIAVAGSVSAQAGESPAIPPELVAEYIHAVIQVDRALYSTHVVERLQDLKITEATEEWKARGTVPLPAQMLQMAGQVIQGQGLGLRIRLASLWPLYEKNGPVDQFEREGLEAVAKDPRRPYTGIIVQEDRRFFKAIYADRAVAKACVQCHNTHATSPKRNYNLYDVMGGVIISFPVP